MPAYLYPILHQKRVLNVQSFRKSDCCRGNTWLKICSVDGIEQTTGQPSFIVTSSFHDIVGHLLLLPHKIDTGSLDWLRSLTCQSQ